MPFARRPLAPAPRLLDLALDRWALDPGAGAAVVAAGYRGLDDELRAAVRAVLHRRLPPVVGAVAADHDALAAVAAAVAETSRPLWIAPLAALVDPARRALLLREAVLFDAAIAVELDRDAGVVAGAAIEQLAARAPTFLLYGHAAAPPRLAIASLTIPSRPPSAAQIAVIAERCFGPGPPAVGDARLPHHPAAIARAAHAIEARGVGDGRVTSSVRAVVEQILPVTPAGALRLTIDDAPLRGAEGVDRVIQRWHALDAPRRLSVLVVGARGLGKARLAAAVAHRLEIPAFQIDRATPVAAALVEAIDAGAAIAVLRELSEEEIRGLRSNLWWAGARGLLFATTTKRIDASDASDFDLQLRLEPPTARERAALWASALASRGAALDGSALADLARFPIGERRIAGLVRAATELTLGSLVAAIQRELGGGDKLSP